MKLVMRVVLILFFLLLGFIVTRPDTFHIERSTVIAAPPEKITASIADFHAWKDWSPWDHMDPEMKKSYDGTAGTPGSSYSWVGNDKVGQGKMTLTDVQPGQSVTIHLEFIKPFASTNTTTFMVSPQAEGAKVTWNMDGKNNLMSKTMSLFMNMDKMVGPDFEHGLAALKKMDEMSAAGDSSAMAPAATAATKHPAAK